MLRATMRIATGVIVAFGLASATGAVAQSAKDWVDIKNPKELRALFSGKTHRGKGIDGTPYVAHFNADGRGLLLWEGQQYPRTWGVKGSEVCVTATTGPITGTHCRKYQRHRKNKADYVGQNVADGTIVQFTVEDGIPKF